MLYRVVLVLAREPGHPAGSSRTGYDLVLPLDPDGRLDPSAWVTHRSQCGGRHFEEGQADRDGKLNRRGDKSWYMDYEPGTADDELGFRLDREHFIVGEYVSIKDRAGKMHTYRISAIEPLSTASAASKTKDAEPVGL